MLFHNFRRLHIKFWFNWERMKAEKLGFARLLVNGDVFLVLGTFVIATLVNEKKKPIKVPFKDYQSDLFDVETAIAPAANAISTSSLVLISPPAITGMFVCSWM